MCNQSQTFVQTKAIRFSEAGIGLKLYACEYTITMPACVDYRMLRLLLVMRLSRRV
jgi:hypothetical protein